MKKGSGTEGFLFVSIMALEIRLQKDNIGGQKASCPKQFLAGVSGAEEVTTPDNPLDICQLLKHIITTTATAALNFLHERLSSS